MATYTDIIEQATSSLTSCQTQLKEDSAYYEAEVPIQALGTAMPPSMQNLRNNVGLSRLYLDALTERIDFTGFRYPNSNESDDTLQQWWEINSLGENAPMAHLETLIHGRCYVTVSAPSQEDIAYGYPSDVPIIKVESPRHMWVEIDPRTSRVMWAVRFYSDPNPGMPRVSGQRFTLYLPNETVYLSTDSHGNVIQDPLYESVTHNLGIVPVVPFYNRERVADKHGRSEIIPEIRSTQDVASRVVMNMQAASEMMAVPQRLLFGVDKSEIDPSGGQDPYAKYKAFMANILTFSNKEGGASAEQFSAAELSNYTIVLQELFKHAASYTGLPPQYLTFQSDNPASADAIRASESRLVKKCELKGRMFGNDWEQVMRVAKMVMGQTLTPDDFRISAIMADPATPTWAAKADAAQKLVAGKAIIPVKRARIDLGYTPEEREEMERWDEEENEELAAAMMGTTSSRFQLETSTTPANSDSSEQTEDSPQ